MSIDKIDTFEVLSSPDLLRTSSLHNMHVNVGGLVVTYNRTDVFTKKGIGIKKRVSNDQEMNCLMRVFFTRKKGG